MDRAASAPRTTKPLPRIPLKDCHRLLQEQREAHAAQDAIREASHAAHIRGMLYVIVSLFTLISGILGLRAWLGRL